MAALVGDPCLDSRIPMDDKNVVTGKGDLTTASFESLLLRLDPDRNRAGEKYENLRRRLIKFFQWNDCFPEGELADETLDRVAQKLGSIEIRDVGAFLWGVAKNVAREAVRKPPTSGLDDLPPGMEPHTRHAELPIIERAENERRLQCLHQCIQKLSAADRELFLDYEYFTGKAENTQALAERFQLSLSALQSKAHRLKVKIEKCALKCFAFPEKLRLPLARNGGDGHDR